MITKGLRLTIFIILTIIVGIIFYFLSNSIFLQKDVQVLIFSFALMLAFSSLVIEHYFTKPTDVLSTGLAILLSIGPLYQELSSNMGRLYWILVFAVGTLCLLSLISMILFTPEQSLESKKNRISATIKDFVTRFGSAKAQFFILLILTMLFYIDTKSNLFLALFFFSCFVLIDPWKFLFKLISLSEDLISPVGIGQLVGVQGKNTFLIKLFDTRPTIKIFDPVEFEIQADLERNSKRGLVLDNYVLNEEQWIKILANNDITEELKDIPLIKGKIENIIYKLEFDNKLNFLEKFVGLVTENTTIKNVKFIYSSSIDIQEGQLLEIKIDKNIILYQIVQGTLQSKRLENKNETGYIVGDAVQLGIWNVDKGKFEKYGWVPEINVPIFLASNIPAQEILKGEFKVGNIPGTNYPVVMKKDLAITHHLAVLGVTGTGKSVFSRNLIREYVKDGVKIICVDFTGEYKQLLSDLSPSPIITNESEKELFKLINWKQNELEKFPSQQSKDELTQKENKIQNLIKDSVNLFLKSKDKKITLFELPDVVNTTGIFDYTKSFLKCYLKLLKMKKVMEIKYV